jgi:hypothetical protein
VRSDRTGAPPPISVRKGSRSLLIVPVVLGQGARLFPATGPDIALDLIESRTDSKGVTIQIYRPAGRPHYAPATA